MTAAATMGVALVTGAMLIASNTPAEQTVTAAPAVTGLPPEFTAADGVAYHRVGTATLDTTGKRKVTITVPNTGKPLDLVATCAGDRRSAAPHVRVDGVPARGGFLGACVATRQTIGLPVRGQAEEVTVTLELPELQGTACVRERKDDPCKPVTPRQRRAVWSLGVYEWTPPDEPVLPGPVRKFPAMKGYKPVAMRSGLYPEKGSVTIPVPAGRTVGVDQICTGALAKRLNFTLALNGRDTGVGGQCGVWEKGPYPMAMALVKTPKGADARLTITWSMAGPAETRPVRWLVGVWERIG